MLKIKCDFIQQYLKTVDLHFGNNFHSLDAIHNFKWVKIQIEKFSGERVKPYQLFFSRRLTYMYMNRLTWVFILYKCIWKVIFILFPEKKSFFANFSKKCFHKRSAAQIYVYTLIKTPAHIIAKMSNYYHNDTESWGGGG